MTDLASNGSQNLAEEHEPERSIKHAVILLLGGTLEMPDVPELG